MQRIESISRTTTVANVVDNIRDKILLQEYKTGEMLAEMTLSQEYQTSRGTIRTALLALESEGLVITLSNGRKQIEGITEQYICDLYNMRKVLEKEAVKRVLLADFVDFSPLYSSIAIFNETEKECDDLMKINRFKANEQFHRSLIEMTNNRSLLQCWSTIEPTILALTKFNSATLDASTHKSDYIISHVELLDCLVTKSPVAVDLFLKHIEQAKQDTFICLKKIGCVL